jgi:selenocysteine lyase/cysteine desulfurase
VDFARVRESFPTARNVTYLDLANKNILPQPVIDAVGQFLHEGILTGGDKERWKRVVEEVRAEMAVLIGADPTEIAFVKNTSEGLNIAARALGLKAGDAVILNDLEHPNNVYPWLNLQSEGVEIRWVRSRSHRLDVDGLVAEMGQSVKVVAVSHVTWASGFRTDLKALAECSRERGARLVVDGIQSAGIVSLDVRALGIDVLACGGHKGLLGLHGVGILYCKKELIPSMRPAYAARASMRRADETDHDLDFAEDARRFEIGNPNYLGILALGTGARFIRTIGVPAIEARVLELSGLLLEELRRRGLRTLTPSLPHERAGIVSFSVADPEETVQRLAAEGIIVSARAGAIRASPHIYNTEEEVERLLALL